jgi:DNA helicase HerA-like ATPase
VIDRYPQSLLVDLSLLTPIDQHAFAAAFFARLFMRSRQAIHLFVDEADEFCPQSPKTLSENKVLAELDRLVRRGRIKGVGLTLITQRSAVISKNVLTQVGALFLLRTVGPQDLKAIEEWIKRHHERSVVSAILKTLPGLPRGVLYHVTGGSKKPSKHEVHRKRTWDSSRTPAVGETAVVPELRAVDTSGLEQFLSSFRQPGDKNEGEEETEEAGDRHGGFERVRRSKKGQGSRAAR